MQKALMLLFILATMSATVVLMRRAAELPPEPVKASSFTPVDETLRTEFARAVRSMHYPCVKTEEAARDDAFSFSDFEGHLITRYRLVCDRGALAYFVEYAAAPAIEGEPPSTPKLRTIYSEPLEDIVLKSDDPEFQQRGIYRRHLQSADYPCDEVTAIVWPRGRFQDPAANVGHSRKLRIYCNAGRYAYDFDVGETGKIDEVTDKHPKAQRPHGGSR